ncbi:hypothetical protein ACLOJK_003115 [Asimina triloba]
MQVVSGGDEAKPAAMKVRAEVSFHGASGRRAGDLLRSMFRSRDCRSRKTSVLVDVRWVAVRLRLRLPQIRRKPAAAAGD